MYSLSGNLQVFVMFSFFALSRNGLIKTKCDTLGKDQQMQLAKDCKYKINQDEDNRQNELMYDCRGNKKNSCGKWIHFQWDTEFSIVYC